MIEIKQAASKEDVEAVRQLLEEYQHWLGFDLGYQNFEEEVASLPGKYAPPRGALLIAFVDGTVAGMIAMRPLDTATCEMKRLYVRPSARGHRLGHFLIDRLIEIAIRAGFLRMRLDTVAGKMDKAIAIYQEFGFREIAPYYPSPVEHTTYFEKELKQSAIA